MLTTFAAIITSIAAGVKLWFYFYKKRNRKTTYEEDKQKMEDAIARGHAADITAMFDDVRRPPSDQDNLGRPGSKETP